MELPGCRRRRHRRQRGFLFECRLFAILRLVSLAREPGSLRLVVCQEQRLVSRVCPSFFSLPVSLSEGQFWLRILVLHLGCLRPPASRASASESAFLLLWNACLQSPSAAVTSLASHSPIAFLVMLSRWLQPRVVSFVAVVHVLAVFQASVCMTCCADARLTRSLSPCECVPCHRNRRFVLS